MAAVTSNTANVSGGGPPVSAIPAVSDAHHPFFALSARPTSVSILLPFEGQLYALPFESLSVDVDLCLSLATVTIVGVWRNIANFTSDCLLVVPMNGTVTDCRVQLHDRRIDTYVVNNDDVQSLTDIITKSQSIARSNKFTDDGALIQGKLPPMNYSEFIPDLYRLPIHGVPSTDLIHVTLVYQESLPFIQSSYIFTLPLTFGADLLPPNKSLNDIVKLSVALQGYSETMRYDSPSHTLETRQHAASEQSSPSIISLYVKDFDGKRGDGGSADFQFLYSMTNHHINAMLFTPHSTHSKSTSTHSDSVEFVLYVTPPNIEAVDTFYSRNLVFLLDRSASMVGDCYTECTRALTVILNNLKPADQFSIIAFDSQRDAFCHELVRVTPSNIASVAAFIRQMKPKKQSIANNSNTGTETNILAAIKSGFDILHSGHSGDSLSLNYLVLITDGTTNDEREIVSVTKSVLGHHANTRLLTFGIGSHCNFAFLKSLSVIGRGLCSVVLYKERIYSQLLALMAQASTPVMTDCQLYCDSGSDRKLALVLPMIPDLYISAPLCVHGTFALSLPLPSSLTLTGSRADNSLLTLTIPIQYNCQSLPISRLFLRERIDVLSAQSWLADDALMRLKCVALSVSSNFVCPFTQMLAFETHAHASTVTNTTKPSQTLDTPLLALSSADSSSSELMPISGTRTRARLLPSPSSTSSVLLIGATAFSFGSVAGTLSQLAGVGDYVDHVDAGCCGCNECLSELDCNDCMQC